MPFFRCWLIYSTFNEFAYALTLDTRQFDWVMDVSSSFFVSMDRLTGTDDRLRLFLGCASNRDAGDRFSGSVLVDSSDDVADDGCPGGGGDDDDDSYMARCHVSDRISKRFNRLTTSSNSFSCKYKEIFNTSIL